jgi:hypothetical protein
MANIPRPSYKTQIGPWVDEEPMSLTDMGSCRHCGGRAGLQGAEMEIARLQSICRKTKCGPLENEIVRLRAHIAALENAERIADLKKQGVEREKQRNSKGIADLEKQNANLEKQNADLDSKNDNPNDKVLQLELGAGLQMRGLRRARTQLQRAGRPKQPGDRRETGVAMQEDIEQSKRIIGLGYQIQLLKDEMAYGAMEGSVAGSGGDLSAECRVQRNGPTSKQSSSTVLSSRCGAPVGVVGMFLGANTT